MTTRVTRRELAGRRTTPTEWGGMAGTGMFIAAGDVVVFKDRS